MEERGGASEGFAVLIVRAFFTRVALLAMCLDVANYFERPKVRGPAFLARGHAVCIARVQGLILKTGAGYFADRDRGI